MNIRDFKDRKWVVLGANCYPLYADAFAEPVAREYYRDFGIPTEVLNLYKGSFVEWLYDEKQIISLSEKLLPDLLKNAWEYYDVWRRKAEKYEAFHETVMEKNL